MDQTRVIDKAIASIQKSADHPYLNSTTWQILRDHLYYVFVAGFEEGFRERSTYKPERKIRMYTREGRFIRDFNDAKSAKAVINSTTTINGAVSTIQRACRGRKLKNEISHRAYGFIWKYVDPEV